MTEWQEYRIADTGRVVTGKTPPTANKRNFGGKIPFITPSDMDGTKYIAKTARCITEEGLQTVKNSFLPEGSVMVSCIGSDMGKVSINSLPGVTNQQINSVIVNKNFDPQFVYYALKPRKEEFLTLATSGSAQPILNKGHFSELTFYAPARNTQQKIAVILSSLDKKIELNQQMNETLEGMARAVFKSWFVDFDPVHAKAQGRQPQETGSGAGATGNEFFMPPETAALFPDRFDGNGIPAGWSLKPVSEAIELNPREQIQKGSLCPYLSMSELPTNGSTPEHPIMREFTSGSKFRNGDTLLARITPCLENGKTAYIDCLGQGEVGWGSTEFIVMRAKPPFPNEYTYLLARHRPFRDHAISSMTGTSGRQRVQVDSLGAFEVAVPTEAIGKKFGDYVTPLFKKINANAAEIRTLSALRDALLPKLISGEIRIGEAEETVREAAG